jgi:hypothetical protein
LGWPTRLLDATGVGAVAGVPLNVASAGLIATGAGMAGIGVGGLIMHAASDGLSGAGESPATGRDDVPIIGNEEPEVTVFSDHIDRAGHGFIGRRSHLCRLRRRATSRTLT